MAEAQGEREMALHKAEEAFKHVADAQRKRARIRNIAFVVVSIFAVLSGLLYWNAEQQRKVAEEQKEQADHILESATNIFRKSRDRMDFDTQKEAFAVFKAGADHGDATSMGHLGWLYYTGFGVTQDYIKAREWYEKALDKGYVQAMTNLGVLYASGHGVAQDYAKAREWYEKAADKGDTSATEALEQLSIKELAAAGRYAEALQLQEDLAAKVEAVEAEREGKPGEETAQALTGVAWLALFTREFTKALAVADRAHALLPNDLVIETNRAHALMFLKRGKESKALYLAHKGKPVSAQDDKLWERVIAEDFAELRKWGLTHPMMAGIEKELGVSR